MTNLLIPSNEKIYVRILNASKTKLITFEASDSEIEKHVEFYNNFSHPGSVGWNNGMFSTYTMQLNGITKFSIRERQ